MTPETRSRNRRLGFSVLGGVLLMLGVSFAAVPLYDAFCRATGYNGTPMIGGIAPATGDARSVAVRFDANIHAGLPWRFAPAQPAMRVNLGDQGVAFYVAENLASVPVEGISTYNVTPEVVGRYFHKTACCCFEAQTLSPNQKVDMPLAFWVDPAIADDPNTRDIRTITVSYTFFRTMADAERAGALASAGPHVGRSPTATTR